VLAWDGYGIAQCFLFPWANFMIIGVGILFLLVSKYFMSEMPPPPVPYLHMRPILLGLVFLLSLASARTAMADAQRYLFLDPAILQKTENVQIRINPPEQREMVIRPDKPWEQLMISFFLTVLDEDGKLRMWYACRDKDQTNPTSDANLAYAESTDGVNWTKPNLGLIDYHGSTENNLVGVPSLEGNVYQDPQAASPAEKYIYVTYQKKEGVIRYTSPDGLRWKKDGTPLMNFKADTQNVTFWDANIEKYVVYLRGWTVDEQVWQNKRRQIVRLTSESLSKPLPVVPVTKRGPGVSPLITTELPVVLAVDSEDEENSDIYNISAEPYPLDRRWYIGFPSILKRERSVSDGTVKIHFVGSKDGLTWHKYDRTPYVELKPKNTETPNMAFMGTGVVVRGDEIWQYGTEFFSRHGDIKAREKRTDGAIYRYVQRIDGFVSLDFDAEEGSARTEPLEVTGDQLLLNMKSEAGGSLRVGLLKADGSAIPGFGLGDCLPLEKDSTSEVVSWKGGSLGSLGDEKIQIVFAGRHSKLYSFRFASRRDLNQ